MEETQRGIKTMLKTEIKPLTFVAEGHTFDHVPIEVFLFTEL